MSAYIVFIRDRVRDETELATYGEMVGASFAGHEFKVLVRYGEIETLEGPEALGTVILEFETMDAARAWYRSPAYAEACRHRNLGADYRAFITQGV